MGEEFSGKDLAGARFEWSDLTDAHFELVYLRGARFERSDLTGARIRNSVVKDVDVTGEVESLRVNGVDVVPLVAAELDRLHPERPKLRPVDADGFREAWPVIEALWEATVRRARALDPALLHERVDGEWSFMETLRHLSFATAAWLHRVVLGNPTPWHPLDLPFDEMNDIEGIPRDRDAHPSLEEVLALRSERMADVAAYLQVLTDEALAGSTVPVSEAGFPESNSYPVHEALMVILNEEWWHRRFAERDLATLFERSVDDARYALRPATESDIDFLVDVVVAATRAQDRWPAEIDEDAFRTDFAARTLQEVRGEIPDSTTSVIEIDGRPIGRLRVTRPNSRIELAGIQLLPDAQGRGIGTSIVASLKAEATRTASTVDLTVEHDNPRARNLYHRLGFHELCHDANETLLRWQPPASESI